MSSFEGVEKAAAAQEAREAVGRAHRGRAEEVEVALKRYLAAEEYLEQAEPSPDAGHGRSDSDELS